MEDSLLKSEWKDFLPVTVKQKPFLEFLQSIKEEYVTTNVYPKESDVFRAFMATPLSDVNVVILGQDPYHNEGQAEGLAFSVPVGAKLPPSLKNIYKEIENDCGIKKDYTNGNLEDWAKQGVLLLNSVLTVAAHEPSSHQGRGWEDLTDSLIKVISDKREHVVFLLWGKYAKSKKNLIDEKKHLILEAPHPSPFSARTGFFGCRHFSVCNLYLKKHNKQEILW